MLSNTITVTYDGSPYSLVRVQESNYQSEFFYRSPTLDLRLQVGHTLPSLDPERNEAHIVTLWAHHFDADGNEVRRERAYQRVQTPRGKQDTTSLVNLDAALRGFVAANAAAIFNRAS